MLYGTHFHVTFREDSSSLGVANILSNAVDDRLSFNINTLYLVAVVFRSRQKSGMDKLPGVQSFSLNRELTF